MLRHASILASGAEAVLSVASALSFSGAARDLGVAQTTISRRIRDLEDQLGVSLFERYCDGVRLTAAGRAFLAKLLRSEALLCEAVQEARQAGTAEMGAVRIGFIWSFACGVASEVLNLFRQEHPEIGTHLTELGASALLGMLHRRELDCAWLVPWHELGPTLRAEPLWSERLHLASRTGLIGSDHASWEDLGGRPFLCRQTDDWPSFQPALNHVDGPSLNLQVHDCSRDSLLTLVACGDGVTVHPESIAAQGFPGVEFKPFADPRATLQLRAIYRRETDNPALRRLLAVTRDWLRRSSSTLQPQ